jgi:hypothetical protein
MAEGTQNRNIVACLDAALDELHALELIVARFRPENQAAACASLKRVATTLCGIDNATSSLEGIDVPVQLLEWIDQGKDADSFYQQLFKETIWNAQVCVMHEAYSYLLMFIDKIPETGIVASV